MLTQNDINAQIERRIKEHQTKIFDGELPKNFLKQFRKAIMVVPPAQHQLTMSYVEMVLQKTEDQLTITDTAMLLNVIFLASFDKLYSDLDEGIAATKELDLLKMKINDMNFAFEESLKRQHRKLMELAGLDKKTAPFAPIIGNA